MKNKSILIADDHSIIRYGIILLIHDIFEPVKIHEAATFTQAKKILSENAVDLLMLDINIPGGDNVKMVGNIKDISPKTRILMFSAYSGLTYAVRYIQAGADGYLDKDSSEAEIKRAIEMVMSGKTYMSESVKENAIQQIINGSETANGIATLSNRELDVAKLLVKGMGILEISGLMNLQMSTISTYKKRIFEKLAIKNLAELIHQFNVHA